MYCFILLYFSQFDIRHIVDFRNILLFNINSNNGEVEEPLWKEKIVLYKFPWRLKSQITLTWRRVTP